MSQLFTHVIFEMPNIDTKPAYFMNDSIYFYFLSLFLCSDLNKYSFPHFPLLELNDGNHIFSTDAIIKYLLPNEKPIELRDQVRMKNQICFYSMN